jgi:hypothetical protein
MERVEERGKPNKQAPRILGPIRVMSHLILEGENSFVEQQIYTTKKAKSSNKTAYSSNKLA